MVPFCDKLKHIKKGLKVKIFLNFFGTYKEVRQVADITTTISQQFTCRELKPVALLFNINQFFLKHVRLR